MPTNTNAGLKFGYPFSMCYFCYWQQTHMSP